MKILGFINWIFFLFLFILIFYESIEGIQKSIDNNYLEERKLQKREFNALNKKIKGSEEVKQSQNAVIDVDNSINNGSIVRSRSFNLNDTQHNSISQRLYRFPHVLDSNKVSEDNLVDGIPYEVLTHIVFPGFIHSDEGPYGGDTYVLPAFLKIAKEKEMRKKLKGKNLLINFKFFDFVNYIDDLQVVYQNLDTLSKAFPESFCGIVFEMQVDHLMDSLNVLSMLGQQATILGDPGKFSSYLCLNYPDQTDKSKFVLKGLLDRELSKNVKSKLPNFQGYILKTFDYDKDRIGDIKFTFQALEDLLNLINLIEKDRRVAFTYEILDENKIKDSLIQEIVDLAKADTMGEGMAKNIKEEGYTLGSLHKELDSLNDEMFFNTLVALHQSNQKKTFGETLSSLFTGNQNNTIWDKLLEDRILPGWERINESSKSFTRDSLIICIPTYPIAKLEEVEIKGLNIKPRKEPWIRMKFPDASERSLLENFDDKDIFINSLRIELDSIKMRKVFFKKDSLQLIPKLDTNLYMYTNVQLVDTSSRQIKYIFETKETLVSKMDAWATLNLNIGFWNMVDPVYRDKTAAPLVANPIITIFKNARGNLVKKLPKGKSPINQDFVAVPDCEGIQNCYWHEITKDYERGLPKLPDYLLVLLSPYLAIKILLPLFSIILFVDTFNRGVKLLSNLRVPLVGLIPVPSRIFMVLESVLWSALTFLIFIPAYYDDLGLKLTTTRNFAFIILLFLAMGRPIIKLFIKLIKFFGKEMKNEAVKKFLKILPQLGELFYTEYFDENEKKQALKHAYKQNEVGTPLGEEQNPTKLLEQRVNSRNGEELDHDSTVIFADKKTDFEKNISNDSKGKEPTEDEKKEKNLSLLWERLNDYLKGKLASPNYLDKLAEEKEELEGELEGELKEPKQKQAKLDNSKNYFNVGVLGFFISIFLILTGIILKVGYNWHAMDAFTNLFKPHQDISKVGYESYYWLIFFTLSIFFIELIVIIANIKEYLAFYNLKLFAKHV